VVFVNPKALKRARALLTRLQRQLARKVKGSNRYRKGEFFVVGLNILL
jgi:putative transposase